MFVLEIRDWLQDFFGSSGIYRIVREALLDALKHSEANEVEVEIKVFAAEDRRGGPGQYGIGIDPRKTAE